MHTRFRRLRVLILMVRCLKHSETGNSRWYWRMRAAWYQHQLEQVVVAQHQVTGGLWEEVLHDLPDGIRLSNGHTCQ